MAIGLNNLALLYAAQRQYTKAEPLYKHSLEIIEKALGSDHPQVITGLENMAILYRETGCREKAAKELEKRVAALQAKS